MTISIEQFEFHQDNLGFLLHDNQTGATVAIDAGHEEKIQAALQKRGWQLSHILITHHDWDHTDGILSLKKQFNVRVFGPKQQAHKIKGLDELLEGGDTINVGNIELQVIETSGHTKGHISFFNPKYFKLFCGDALFSLGCGRMRESDAKTMWEGLDRLRQLPDQTDVYCGHEYSADNARFALSIDPDNLVLQKRAEEIKTLRAANRSTIPFNLGVDKKANPFLRADDKELGARMSFNSNDPAGVFAVIRKAKDIF
ncbi:Hydroxyacylglutathione hydrolase [hydrothermal vent metagenome]|uniref:hydroxyacylglutathione hydrolase n=1 Tax=hydrothermal vent metagenome TaxID=652676 RepID=A0A3B0THR5_9ZZZZ